MDFDLTDDQRAMQDMARSFAAEELAPLERIVRDRVHQILDGTNQIMRVIIARELFRQ